MAYKGRRPLRRRGTLPPIDYSPPPQPTPGGGGLTEWGRTEQGGGPWDMGPPLPPQRFGTRPSFGDPSGGIIHDPYGMPIMGGGGGTPRPGATLPPRWPGGTGQDALLRFRRLRDSGQPLPGQVPVPPMFALDQQGGGPVPLDFIRAAFAARRRGF